MCPGVILIFAKYLLRYSTKCWPSTVPMIHRGMGTRGCMIHRGMSTQQCILHRRVALKNSLKNPQCQKHCRMATRRCVIHHRMATRWCIIHHKMAILRCIVHLHAIKGKKGFLLYLVIFTPFNPLSSVSYTEETFIYLNNSVNIRQKVKSSQTTLIVGPGEAIWCKN